MNDTKTVSTIIHKTVLICLIVLSMVIFTDLASVLYYGFSFFSKNVAAPEISPLIKSVALWINITAAISLILLLIFMGYFQVIPNLKLIQLGSELNQVDYPALIQAIIDLGQGDFSTQLQAKGQVIKGQNFGNLTPIVRQSNQIVNNLDHLMNEFNSVTGIPCIRMCFVGVDSFLEGIQCAEVMANAIDKKGQVAMVSGSFNHVGQDLRRKGFESYMKENCPDIQVVDAFESRRDKDRMYQHMDELAKKYPQFAGVYFTDTSSHAGGAQYVKDHPKYKYLKLVSHDIAESTIQYIKEGIVTATLSQDPIAQGYNPVIYLYNHITTGWLPNTPRMLTAMDMVTTENYTKFWRDGEGVIASQEILERLAKPITEENQNPVHIVVLGREETLFWGPARDGVKRAADRLKSCNARIEWIVPEENHTRGDISAEVYGNWIDKLVNEKCDGIAIVASDEKLIPYINRAVEAGIPVVTWNSEPTNLANLIYTVKDQAKTLSQLSQNLASNTEKSSAFTHNVKQAIDEVAQGTSIQNEEINATQTILSSLRENIAQVDQQTEESTQAAERTANAVSDSSNALVNTLESMKSVEESVRNTWNIVEELEKHSRKINEVVEMISDIADRVNILSLNAAIEAARAGEHGKAFNVVADEVRNLAKNTREATKTASAIVGDVQAGIDKVGHVMSEGIQRLQETSESTENARLAIENITVKVEDDQNRMTQISEMVSQIREFSNQLGEAMEKVAAVSANTANHVNDVNNSTDEMSRQLDEVAKLTKALENIAVGEQQLLAKFRLKMHDIS